MNCPTCQKAMQPGEISFHQSLGSRLFLGPASMELQFIDAQSSQPVRLGISNDPSSSAPASDHRCPACGLVVISPR